MTRNIIILFFFNFCLAQSKFGTIQYKRVTHKEIEGPAKKMKEVADWINKLNTEADKIEYTLNFNANESFFYANPILISKENGFDFNLLSGTASGKIKYYQNISTKEGREYVDGRRSGVQIVSHKQILNWKLENETKLIDNNLCYKATTPVLLNDGIRKQDKVYTAWYCPAIPLPFGPVGAYGLPGLILELTTDKSTFYASKVDLRLQNEPQIDRLLSPKPITYETYLLLMNGTLSKDQIEGMKEVSTSSK